MSQPVSPPFNLRQQRRKNVGEMAGGTAAECAAVCCCCPFTVMNLLVLAVYKVPAGLCRKALRKQKKKQKKHQLRAKRKQRGGAGGGLLVAPPPPRTSPTVDKGFVQTEELLNDEEMNAPPDSDLDSQMWNHFHTTGFWRSGSDHTHETRTA